MRISAVFYKKLSDDEYVARVRKYSLISRNKKIAIAVAYGGAAVLYGLLFQNLLHSITKDSPDGAAIDRGFSLGIILGVTFSIVLIKLIHGFMTHLFSSLFARDGELLLKYYDLAHAGRLVEGSTSRRL